MLADQLILSPGVIGQLTTDQVVNYLEAKFLDVQAQMAKKPPPPTDELTALESLSWRNRVLLVYGQAIGALQSAQAFGHIGGVQFQALKARLLGTMMHRMADVMSGR